ncbi:MFS general substrate transporter [Conidiobolus coronatus NRRL 28638]|uniref:MFS general substrate transporter n=1 Tax=Conidiobolus coronatus (strain ATCC 28846 / CBS 209.66 / NRRL 28638) TaxID=796925 RepID=A0A137PDM9_CONC2|nr:MFS general substrate transporter [Conidiobolus coronatus NRRL 28638]|eukprot:KXN73072.1 MFS general substrate transporter [Conidiobolus coronatus NRRL 28638]
MEGDKFENTQLPSYCSDKNGVISNTDDNASDINIVLKMAQIRTKFDNWAIYIGNLLLGIAICICSEAIYQLTWSITSKLGYFDIGPVVQVISRILSILFISLYTTLSDIYGRGLMLSLAITLSVIGLFITGSASSFSAYSAGNIIGELGDTGITLLIPIILADFLTPRNRGFGFILFYLPPCIALGASLPVIAAAKEGEKWRWIYNSQGIMTIITSIPILFILFNLQRKAKRLLPQSSSQPSSLLKVDWIGIILLTSGLSCVLIPFSLVVRIVDGWASPSIFVPIIFGVLILIVFIFWETKYTKNPLITRRLLNNKAAMVMILVRASLEFDSSFTWNYMISYLGLTREIDQDHTALIYLGFRVTRFIAGSICAFLIRRFSYTRAIIWTSLVVNAVGMGLALASRHPHSAEWFVVFGEAVIGLGSGFSECAGLVILQSTVDFSEIANVSAVDSLVTNVFNTVALSITNALWNSYTWTHLMNRLPDEYHELIPNLLANNNYTELLPLELKENWISALGDSQWIMCTIGTVLACVCFVFSLLLPPIDLDKCQKNAQVKGIMMDQATSH